MIVAVRGELLALKPGFLFSDGGDVFCASHHRLEILVILAGECLGCENDLMFGIDRDLGVVALNDAVRSRHLDRFLRIKLLIVEARV